MKNLLQAWYDISVRKKILLSVGSVMVVTWALVCVVLVQQRHFSSESSIIMNDYIEITSFLDAFSAENVCLEVYMRETSPESAEEDYEAATNETNRCLGELAPDLSVDRREEYVLKRAINNAMSYYRISQERLLDIEEGADNIPQYLSMKTQATYIDGYTRELLYIRMEQGDQQWQEIVKANDISTKMFSGLLILGTCLILFVLWFLAHSVLAPLTELGHAANQISDGQYDAPPLPVRGKDEMGRMAASFNLMQREILPQDRHHLTAKGNDLNFLVFVVAGNDLMLFQIHVAVFDVADSSGAAARVQQKIDDNPSAIDREAASRGGRLQKHK